MKKNRIDFDSKSKTYPRKLTRLELLELWCDFASCHQIALKGNLKFIQIIRDNHEYLISRKKKTYPILLFSANPNGETYEKKDALEWFYKLTIHLDKMGKLKVAGAK